MAGIERNRRVNKLYYLDPFEQFPRTHTQLITNNLRPAELSPLFRAFRRFYRFCIDKIGIREDVFVCSVAFPFLYKVIRFLLI